jgi:hypothetical protein
VFPAAAGHSFEAVCVICARGRLVIGSNCVELDQESGWEAAEFVADRVRLVINHMH